LSGRNADRDEREGAQRTEGKLESERKMEDLPHPVGQRASKKADRGEKQWEGRIGCKRRRNTEKDCDHLQENQGFGSENKKGSLGGRRG